MVEEVWQQKLANHIPAAYRKEWGRAREGGRGERNRKWGRENRKWGQAIGPQS